ncbi:MAG: hypothetical protein L3K18_07590 [Thermoplasmata archaeon]|nr:hypothetical protein [Thermoplasmata archaeon]
MSAHCPACGTEVEVTPRAIEVESGTCPGCSRAFLLLPPNADLTTSTVVHAPATEAADAEGEDEEEISANCAECGGTLTLSVDDENALAATCDDCETVFHLVRAGAEAAVASPVPSIQLETDDRPRPRSRNRDEGGRGDFPPRRDRDFGGGGGGAPMSRARPCRKCGGPIVFSDGDDGGMVGTCQSCGNRFSLRPRTEGGGGGDDRRSFSGSRSRGPPPWKRGGGGGGGGRFGSGPPRRPSYGRDRSDSSDDERPRRRRRED